MVLFGNTPIRSCGVNHFFFGQTTMLDSFDTTVSDQTRDGLEV